MQDSREVADPQVEHLLGVAFGHHAEHLVAVVAEESGFALATQRRRQTRTDALGQVGGSAAHTGGLPGDHLAPAVAEALTLPPSTG